MSCCSEQRRSPTVTTPIRRRLRQGRRALWYALALGMIALALMAGITSQLLPLVERHPERSPPG